MVQTIERVNPEMGVMIGRQEENQLQPLGCLTKYRVLETVKIDKRDTAKKYNGPLKDNINQESAIVADDILDSLRGFKMRILCIANYGNR